MQRIRGNYSVLSILALHLVMTGMNFSDNAEVTGNVFILVREFSSTLIASSSYKYYVYCTVSCNHRIIELGIPMKEKIQI